MYKFIYTRNDCEECGGLLKFHQGIHVIQGVCLDRTCIAFAKHQTNAYFPVHPLDKAKATRQRADFFGGWDYL